ncbi:MAG: histidinol-phosphate transaminase [Bacillota bacterium]
MSNNLALAHIKEMRAYPVHNERCSGGIVNLDFNERVSDHAVENQLRCSYPEYGQLTAAIANYSAVNVENVLPCNGSDQAIDLVLRTFAESGAEIIIPQPSFAMYPQWAAVNRLKVITPVYNYGYSSYPLQQVLDGITPATRVVIVCNPNNPTGAQTGLATIERLAATAPDTIIFVDEAYGEYSNVSAINLLAKYPNIIITRTFSKAFGLAGHRIGYILASPSHIAELRKVRGPFDVNTGAVAAVLQSLADTSSMHSYCQEVMTVAKPLVEGELARLGITYLPSAANFLLIQHPFAETIADQLMQSGWRVKTLQLDGLGSCLRVTIGPLEKMQQWLAALSKIISGQVQNDV